MINRGSVDNNVLADIFHSSVTAWVVLGISLLFTIMAWTISNAYVESRAQDRMQFEVDKAIRAIEKRMEEYEQVLRGGVGLFKATDNVSRSMWKEYVSTLLIDTYWPGIQGVGYSEMIEPQDVQEHIENIQNNGHPNYIISSGGEREIYSSIIYLEPFSGRNLRAFGYDMYSNPVRREAMDRATDTGKPALSGKVTLVQETNKDIQAGFLVYLPLYHSNMPIITLEERRAALRGYVYSPFRVKDLLRGILGGNSSLIGYQIYDGETLNADQLLYDSRDKEDLLQSIGNYVDIRALKLQGRRWTIQFHSHVVLDKQLGSPLPSMVATGGLVVDILLFFIITSIVRHRKNLIQHSRVLTQALDELQINYKRLKRTHQVASIGSWQIDLSTNQLIWSDETYHIFGLSPGAPIDYEKFIELIHPDDRSKLDKAWNDALKGKPYNIEHRIIVNSKVKWVHEQAEFSFNTEQLATIVDGSVQDITDGKDSEKALRLAEKVLLNAHEGILITDIDNHIVDVNPMFTAITGYNKEDVIGRNPSILSGGRQDKNIYQKMWGSLNKVGSWQGELWNRHKDGSEYLERLDISVIQDPESGNILNYVGMFSDTTEVRIQQQKMEYMAHHDALTGLPNRSILIDRLDVAVSRSKRHNSVVCLIFLDLDDFKPVNDTFGHDIGDKALIEVASRLHHVVRDEDTAARLGGDEFAILITDQQLISDIEEFTNRVLKSLSEPYSVDFHEFKMSASMGVALFPHHAATAKELLIKADKAMYAAKESGRNCCHILDDPPADA